MGVLEGKELEGSIGEIGSYSVDVTAQGKITIDSSIGKDFGHTKVSSKNTVETDIFKIAAEICKKTETTLDDKALEALKSLLGIKDDEVNVMKSK